MLSDIECFLEVQTLDQDFWKQEGEFVDFSDAYEYAMENYPHNCWRINDENSVLYQYNSLDGLINSAVSEITRFTITESWNRYHQRVHGSNDLDVDLEDERICREFLSALGGITSEGNIRNEISKFKEEINWTKEGF